MSDEPTNVTPLRRPDAVERARKAAREAGATAGNPALLDEIRNTLRKYVILPAPEAYVAVVLWIVATHAAGALHHAPRLAIRSPEKRCGKTRLLDVVGQLCASPLWTVNASTAAIYRVMGGKNPRTLLMDEADAIWGTAKGAEQYEDLRALVNAGFETGRPVLRYDVAARCVVEFDTYGFVALAAIRTLPDTITDRSVNIVMRRRKNGETVQPYRARVDGAPLLELRQRIADWVEGVRDPLGDARPENLPVEDRAADVWEGLIAVGDAAGGQWPRLARTAALKLTAEHDREDNDASDSLLLLRDIRRVFTEGRKFLPSRELVSSLRMLDDSPWSEDDLTTVKLAKRLRPYNVRPERDTTGKVRGYKPEQFADVFERYLPEKDED